MHAEIPCTELISPQNIRTQEHKNQWQNNTLAEGCSSKSLCTQSKHTYCAYASNCYGWATGRCSKQTTEFKKKKKKSKWWRTDAIFFSPLLLFSLSCLKLLYIFHSYMVRKIDDQSFLFIPFLVRFLLWFSRNISANTCLDRCTASFVFCFYFLKHNISSEENGDTTHRDRVIPNIIYSLQ